MKHFSLGLNILLLIAVIFLFAKIYGHHGPDGKKPGTEVCAPAGTQHLAPIAYIELDSLNQKIDYIKSRRKDLEGEQESIDAAWREGYAGLENKKNAFLKKGNSITQQEAEQFQNELLQEQQSIDGRKQELSQKLNEKSYKFMDDIQKQLKDFLAGYNADHKYQYILTTGTGLDYMIYKDSAYNITNDVIKGMNEKMKGK